MKHETYELLPAREVGMWAIVHADTPQDGAVAVITRRDPGWPDGVEYEVERPGHFPRSFGCLRKARDRTIQALRSHEV